MPQGSDSVYTLHLVVVRPDGTVEHTQRDGAVQDNAQSREMLAACVLITEGNAIASEAGRLTGATQAYL